MENRNENGGFSMVMVCKDHVTKGLRVLPAPHVKRITEKGKQCCLFCKQQAAYQLFILNSSTHFITSKMKQKKVEIEKTIFPLPVESENIKWEKEDFDKILV
jgi:hypothetical protein